MKMFRIPYHIEKRHWVLILLLLFITTCTIEKFIRDYKMEKKRTLIKSINSNKLNYVSRYSPGWRVYGPNLKGAIGWEITNCYNYKEKEIIGDKIVVDSIDVYHKEWGDYDGTIYGRYIKNNFPIKTGYKCFKPDYKIGNWLMYTSTEY